MSNNSQPKFTDEEVITIFLFGIFKKHRTIKDIYEFTRDYLHDWFLKLPCYAGYVQRLNQMGENFLGFINEASVKSPFAEKNLQIHTLIEWFYLLNSPIYCMSIFILDFLRITHQCLMFYLNSAYLILSRLSWPMRKEVQTLKSLMTLPTKGTVLQKAFFTIESKVHILALKRPSTLPLPDYIGLTPTSRS